MLPDDGFEAEKNRYSADADGHFVDPNGRMANISVEDTYGCSGEQIVNEIGRRNHLRFGPTMSLLLDWIALNS